MSLGNQNIHTREGDYNSTSVEDSEQREGEPMMKIIMKNLELYNTLNMS